MTPAEMEKRIVRYGDLQPCKTAFIDAHTPGSNRKENFTIIGGGVSESPDQHVHIRETPGFKIGAAGQPPGCRNSLHSHRTAEVFFVLKGRWRFFWGRWGTAGEVFAEEGDIINIPTGIFRAFENVGTDYGMIMAVLGGNDAGGGVIWAPQVIEDAGWLRRQIDDLTRAKLRLTAQLPGLAHLGRELDALLQALRRLGEASRLQVGVAQAEVRHLVGRIGARLN